MTGWTSPILPSPILPVATIPPVFILRYKDRVFSLYLFISHDSPNPMMESLTIVIRVCISGEGGGGTHQNIKIQTVWVKLRSSFKLFFFNYLTFKKVEKAFEHVILPVPLLVHFLHHYVIILSVKYFMTSAVSSNKSSVGIDFMDEWNPLSQTHDFSIEPNNTRCRELK